MAIYKINIVDDESNLVEQIEVDTEEMNWDTTITKHQLAEAIFNDINRNEENRDG